MTPNTLYDRTSSTSKYYLTHLMERGGCVYILTNQRNTTLYTGVTSELRERVYDHKAGKHPRSFTARYRLKKLIYYEILPSIDEAIDREKYIKGKSRKWKEGLINNMNSDWRDLWEDIQDW